MSQILKSSGAVGTATILSRLLGLVRERAYAALLSDGLESSAFKFAFQIPNLFRRLLGEGALTAAFIPLFKEKEKLQGDAEMWRAANALLSGLLLAALGLTLVGVGILAALLEWIHWTDEHRLMLRLLQVMLPYMVFVCIAAICMGMLNSRGHFFIPALGSAVLNVIMISSAYFLAPRMGPLLSQQVFGLAIGVLVAGVAQMLFQWPTLHREGFRLRWVNPFQNGTIRAVVRKMLPSIIGVAAFQINVAVSYGFALFKLGTQHTVADFDNAVRLMELPQGVFGISLATYLLPTLSGLAAEKRIDEFRSTLRTSLSYLWFINLLAAVFLWILAEPMVRLLFESGRWTPDATERTSVALTFLAPGLVFFSTNNILARAFYSLGDVKTPMKISVFTLATNLVLTLSLLVLGFSQSGMALANTVTAAINMGFLFYALRLKLSRLELSHLRREIIKMLLPLLGAAAVTWFASHAWTARVGHVRFWEKAGEVFVPMTAATLVYFGLGALLRIGAAQDILGTLSGFLRPRPAKET